MRKWIVSFIVAFCAAVSLFLPVHYLRLQINEQYYQEERRYARDHLNSIRDDLQSKLDNSLFYADFFEMLVRQNPGINERELREYARFIVERNGIVDNVSLAKDGIIHFIYPLQGNEEAIGQNLMEIQQERKILETAVAERTAVALGPVEAVQGGMKIFNRKPVFIEETSAEDLWGFASVAVDFNHLIENTVQKSQLSNYTYAIKVASNASDSLIWGNDDVFSAEAVTQSIALPENNWTLALVPDDGWETRVVLFSKEMIVFYVLNTIIFVLVFFFIHQYISKRELSRKDALTGLLNKTTFEQSVKGVINNSNKKSGLLLIDLNDFKQINDKHGHLAGDKVLSLVARRMQATVKETDSVGRIGGDEFMILVKNIKTEEDLECAAEYIINKVQKPIYLGPTLIKPSASVGYTLIDQSLPFDKLYETVDNKMYVHKMSQKKVPAFSFREADLEP